MPADKIKNIKNNSGFTIIELVVVMAIFLFIIGGAISIFLSIVTEQKRVLSEQQLLSQISYAEEHMSKALRMAKAETDEGCLTDTANGDDHPGFIYLLTRYDNTSNTSTSQTFRGIKFLNQTDVDQQGKATCQEFFVDPVDSSRPLSADNPLVLKELKGGDTNVEDAVALTPQSLQIKFARFGVDGLDGSSTGCSDLNACGASNLEYAGPFQPKITISLGVVIPDSGTQGSKSCNLDSDCSKKEACYKNKCQPITIIQTTVSQRNLNVQ